MWFKKNTHKYSMRIIVYTIETQLSSHDFFNWNLFFIRKITILIKKKDMILLRRKHEQERRFLAKEIFFFLLI